MDFVALCKNFFAATNIPVSLTRNGQSLFSALGDMIAFNSDYRRELFDIRREKNPCFCGDSSDIEYGRINIEGTDYDVFLGPIFNVPVTEELARQLMRELSLPASYREALTEFLFSIPRTSHIQFAQYLIFFHQCLNHKSVSLEYLIHEETTITAQRKAQLLDNRTEALEEQRFHNSYYYEQELYQKVKEGNVQKLEAFFTAARLNHYEGKLAQSPLRHAKNLFITLTARAGLLGAIPGGLDIEKTYQLMDDYIQECERLQTIEEVTHLQYMMLLDFCQRSGETHIPEGISADVYQCMTYIRSHTNEPISIADASAAVGRSSSYMMKHFKQELGIHMGAYIMRCKLEEAKSLLSYSEKSLAEISSYLCFSSQSYFQNVFKKQYGLTPLQYRRQTKAPSA